MNLFILGSCSPDNPPIHCLINPCDHQTCYNYPDAQCVLDNCGQCQAKFIINGTDNTDQCSMFHQCYSLKHVWLLCILPLYSQ